MADHDQPKVHRRASGPAKQGPETVPRTQSSTPSSERSSAAKQINRSLKAWRDASGGGAATAAIPSGGGNPLAGGLRQSMEKKLGAGLSDVNVHTGGASASAAKDLNARAFTTGTDVHFGAGEFNPGTKEGKKLIAHELTHVVQAKRSGISRSEDEGKQDESAEEGAAPRGEVGGEQLEVSDPDEPAEKEADEVSEKVTEDEPDGDAAETKEQSPEVAPKSISIAAKLKGVGLKVFRSGPPPLPNSPNDPKKPQREKAAEWKTKIDAAFGGGAGAATPELAALLNNAELKAFMNEHATVTDVQQLKGLFDRTFEAAETMAETEVALVTQIIDGIDVKANDAQAKLDSAKTHVNWLKWKSHPIFGESGKCPTVYALGFKLKADSKATEIQGETRKREAMNVATPPDANNPAEPPQLKELRLRKDYCMKLLEQQFAASVGRWKALGGGAEIAGLALKLLSMFKPDLGIPGDVVDITKDAAGALGKGGELDAAVNAIFAKGYVESIDSLEQIQSLMSMLEVLKENSGKVLGVLPRAEGALLERATMLEREALAKGENKFQSTPGAGGAAQTPAPAAGGGGVGGAVKNVAGALDQTENQDQGAKPAVKAALDARTEISVAADSIKSLAATMDLKEAFHAYREAAKGAKEAKEALDKFLEEQGATAPAPTA